MAKARAILAITEAAAALGNADCDRERAGTREATPDGEVGPGTNPRT